MNIRLRPNPAPAGFEKPESGTALAKIPCKSDKFIYKRMYSDNNRANFLQNLYNIDWCDIVDPVEHMYAHTLYSAFIQKFLIRLKTLFQLKN